MDLPLPGMRFQRKYEIESVLGRGGFAVVYLATDVEVGREVAIKVLTPREDGYSSDLSSRFLREARVIAGLRDPHTITMFDFGRSEEGLLFMVFEYISGRDLSTLIREVGPLTEEATVHILVQVLRALREAHAAGVLHRDIKPANILVFDYMEDALSVKLLDFGIAKPSATPGGDPVATLTRAGAMVGTPRYMSPEQIYGEEITPASDLYCLGLVAHELLTGRPAIGGTNTKETLQAQLSDRPLRLPQIPGLSLQVRGVIEQMTSRDAAFRFQSAADVLAALGHAPRTTPQVRATPQPQPALDFAPQPRVTPQSTPRHTTGRSAAAPMHTTGRSAAAPMHTTGRSAAARPPTLDENGQPVGSERPDLLTLVGVGAVGVLVTVVALIALMALDDDDDIPRRQPAPVVAEMREPVAEPRRQPDPPAPAPDPAAAPDAGEASAVIIVDPAEGAPPEVDPGACMRPAPFVGDRRFAANVKGVERFWIAYAPQSYEPGKRHPVVVMFHDHTRTGMQMLQDTQMRQVADENGVVLIALDALDTQKPWQEPGDISFIEEAVDETSKALCIDPARIFAFGHNTGAAMVETAACQYRFSGIATTAYRENRDHRGCEADPPVPHIHLEGTRNKYYPLHGGMGCKGSDVIPLSEKEDRWWARNGCSGAPTTFYEEKSGKCLAKSCREAAFVSCRLDGGRDFPNSAPRVFELDWCKVRAPDFDFATVIWKFFAEHGQNRLSR